MKTIVITGAGKGIGFELTKQLCSKNKVYAVCRKASDELKNLSCEVIEGIDITEESSIARLQKELKGISIDLLLNNAGIAIWKEEPNLKENILKQIEVNAIAPLMVTRALENNLSEGSVVIMMSSRMASISDNTSGKSYGYRASKTALNSLTKTLTFELDPKGIITCLMHPGSVSTEMNPRGQIKTKECVEKLIKRIENVKKQDSGKFLRFDEGEIAW
ncbi:short-chain dehydrogenase [Candidatus Aerophobetes bacterium]|uniref:Short-chain dehydrogenase n=1 Tax=Aerophobetes bacterium TaxID=2030807 RepID=A0A2A4YGB1_UNCAE|nr:MAG: short-chain dehydrogenase [Candidatus Aerophobetes bacterium]